MYIRIVTFRLDGISTEQYEVLATEIAEQFTHWPGLTSKLWLADREQNRFGGVYVFDSKEDADQSRGTPLFTGLATNPHFSDLTVHEYHTLAAPTGITAPNLTPVS